MVNKSPVNARGSGDANSVPGLGRSPGGGHGNPLQYSCLENPMDRGVWCVTACRVSKNWTCLRGTNSNPTQNQTSES